MVAFPRIPCWLCLWVTGAPLRIEVDAIGHRSIAFFALANYLVFCVMFSVCISSMQIHVCTRYVLWTPNERKATVPCWAGMPEFIEPSLDVAPGLMRGKCWVVNWTSMGGSTAVHQWRACWYCTEWWTLGTDIVKRSKSNLTMDMDVTLFGFDSDKTCVWPNHL